MLDEEERLDSVVVLPTVVASFSSMPMKITPEDTSSPFFIRDTLDMPDFPDVCEFERDRRKDGVFSVEGRGVRGMV